MQRSLTQLQRMWVHILDCGPVANTQVQVANNVVPMHPLVAINVGLKRALIAVPDDSYCGPLQLPSGTFPVATMCPSRQYRALH
jgi:hypothetical protein